MALIVTDDELEFDTHRAPPGSRNRGMIQAILPEFFAYPQHLHALMGSLPPALYQPHTAQQSKTNRPTAERSDLRGGWGHGATTLRRGARPQSKVSQQLTRT